MKYLLQKINLWWKQFRCSHTYASCNRWHWTHYPNDNDYRSIEVEYICNNCGKVIYIHLFGIEAKEWEFVMGDYKKE
jgi:hypothetical protein